MKLKSMTQEQRDKVCQYFMDKYAPIAEDRMRHNIWKACEHCPFGVPDGMGSAACGEYLLDDVLPKELLSIVKGDK